MRDNCLLSHDVLVTAHRARTRLAGGLVSVETLREPGPRGQQLARRSSEPARALTSSFS